MESTEIFASTRSLPIISNSDCPPLDSKFVGLVAVLIFCLNQVFYHFGKGILVLTLLWYKVQVTARPPCRLSEKTTCHYDGCHYGISKPNSGVSYDWVKRRKPLPRNTLDAD